MKAHRLYAMMLVVTACVMSAVALQSPVYALVMGVAGVLGTRRRWTWSVRRMHVLIVVLLLALISAIQFRVELFSHRFADLNAVALASWQTLIRLLLTTMVLTLYVGRSRRCPAALVLFVPALAACVGQVALVYDLDAVHRVLEAVSVALAVLYAWTLRIPSAEPNAARPGQGTVLAAILLLITLNAGWALGSVLYDQQDRLNVLASLLGRARTVESFSEGTLGGRGFLDSGRIHALQDMLLEPSPETLFHVECDEAPRYLRTGVFERYTPWRWHSVVRSQRRRPVSPDAQAPDLPGPGAWFRVEPAPGDRWRVYRVLPQGVAASKLFTALGTDWIRASTRRLIVSFSGMCDTEGSPDQIEPYSFAVPLERPPQSLPDAYRQACLQVPDTLDPRIGALAAELFAEAPAHRDKITAVQRHFLENYTYSLSTDVSERRDFLGQFLFETDRGFCEYFATAGAILLRLGDVPTRYVTGVYVTERERPDGVWVARAMDAHAWVEAWNETAERWEIVDPTVPAEQAGAAGDTDDPMGRRSALQWGRLWAMLYRFGLAGPVLWLLEPLGLPWLTPLLLALGAAAVAVFLIRRRRRIAEREGSAEAGDALRRRLDALRRRADRRLVRRGLHRARWQTLHAFATHVEHTLAGPSADPIARWYRQYALLRYAPVSTTDAAAVLQQLDEALSQWPR